MAPDWLGREVTPNDLWHMKRTLILTYSHDPSSAYNDKVWPEVRHEWGDKQTANSLWRFLSGKQNKMEMFYSKRAFG